MARRSHSNVCFGFEGVDWSTSTASHLAATRDSVRRHGADHFKERVNPDNKTVHWKLGNDRTEYVTSNALPDPTRAGIQRTEANTKDIKKTNFVLGYDGVDYDWKRGPNQDEINLCTEQFVESNRKVVEANAAAKATTNIVWGFDKPETVSETKSRFVDHKFGGQTKQEKDRIKTFVRDLKTCAVHFGHDQMDYATTNSLPFHDVVQRGLKDDRAKLTKQMQQESSITFGFCRNEFETSTGVQFAPPTANKK